MLYILCEDSGSGFRFYDKLRKIVSDKQACTVLSSKGNQNYMNKLREVFESLSEYDKLLLAFDSIEETGNFSPKNILDLAKNYCKKSKIELWYTKYYCFEELFLSYSCLLEMSRTVEDGRWYNVLSYVNECLMKEENYYDKENLHIKFIISKAKYASNTREKCSKALLYNITRLIKGNFTISDGEFGECWLSECSKIKMKNKVYVCSNCKSEVQGKNEKEKLFHFEKKSLSSLYLPFTDFFQ